MVTSSLAFLCTGTRSTVHVTGNKWQKVNCSCRSQNISYHYSSKIWSSTLATKGDNNQWWLLAIHSVSFRDSFCLEEQEIGGAVAHLTVANTIIKKWNTDSSIRGYRFKMYAQKRKRITLLLAYFFSYTYSRPLVVLSAAASIPW